VDRWRPPALVQLQKLKSNTHSGCDGMSAKASRIKTPGLHSVERFFQKRRRAAHYAYLHEPAVTIN